MRRLLPSLMFCTFVILPQHLSAQGGQGANAGASDAMRWLRSAPLTAEPGEPYEVLPGVPGAFPRDLLPEGALPRLASDSESMMVVVAALERGRPFDRIRYEWSLDDSGWISTTPWMRGFSMAPASPEIRVCRNGILATILVGTPADGNLVRASVGKHGVRSCSAGGIRTFTDVPVPMLTLPPGARILADGSGGGLDESSSRARIETALPVEALASHLVPQFVEAGWTLESGPTDDEVMAVVRFSGASRAGDPVTAQLIITAFPGTPYVDAVARFVRLAQEVRGASPPSQMHRTVIARNRTLSRKD